jgi:tripartite-type tricarboxylate transporter receptor subunit TctC
MAPDVNRRRLCLSAAALPLAELSRTVAAAGFPSRPVRIITQGAAGSGPDVIARLVADKRAASGNSLLQSSTIPAQGRDGRPRGSRRGT